MKLPKMNEWIIICTLLAGCFALAGGYLQWKKGNLDSESTIQNQKKVNDLQEKLLDKSDKLSTAQQNLVDQSEKLSKAQEELLKNSKGLIENQQKVIDLQTELTKKNQTIEDLQNETLNSLTGGSGIPVLSISTSNAYVSFAISNGTDYTLRDISVTFQEFVKDFIDRPGGSKPLVFPPDEVHKLEKTIGDIPYWNDKEFYRSEALNKYRGVLIVCAVRWLRNIYRAEMVLKRNPETNNIYCESLSLTSLKTKLDINIVVKINGEFIHVSS